jgi:hypothetical protein
MTRLARRKWGQDQSAVFLSPWIGVIRLVVITRGITSQGEHSFDVVASLLLARVHIAVRVLLQLRIPRPVPPVFNAPALADQPY